MNVINLFINSKNRKKDESVNKFQITLANGLLKLNEDEYFSLTITNFHCFNQWYNIREGNNHFQLVEINTQTEITNITNYKIDEGNYNALQLKDKLNEMLLGKLEVKYDKIRNLFQFIKLSTNKLFFNIINCQLLFGLDAEKYIELPIISSYPINMINDTILNIAISGDIQLTSNNFHNYRTHVIEPTNIIFQQCISSLPYLQTMYNNYDCSKNYYYILDNKDTINSFNLELYNEKLQHIEHFPDYYLTIQLKKHKRVGDINVLIKNIQEYLALLFQMAGLILEKLNIF